MAGDRTVASAAESAERAEPRSVRAFAILVSLAALAEGFVLPAFAPTGWPAWLAALAPLAIGLGFLPSPLRWPAARRLAAVALALLGVVLASWPTAELRSPAPWLAALAAGTGLALRLETVAPWARVLSRSLGGFQLVLAVLALAVNAASGAGNALALGLSASFAHLLCGAWLLAAGLEHDDQRMLRTCASLLSGLALLVMAGWALDNAVIVQGGTEYVPMQFNTALCALLMSAALGLLRAGRRGPAWAVLSPVLLLSVVTLLEEYGGWGVGAGEWLVRHGIVAEGVVPGRMAPNTATAFLLGALGVLLAPPAGDRALARWSATWACGFVVSAIAAIVLTGYLLGIPELRGWGSYTPMALMTGISIGLIGLGLGFAGAAHRQDTGHRAVWVPLVVAMVAIAASVMVWFPIDRDQATRERIGLHQQALGVQQALEAGVEIRRGALRRMAERLARPGDEAERQATFEFEARAYLRDFPSFVALVRVAPDGTALDMRARRAAPETVLGESMLRSPRRSEAFRRAATMRDVQSTRSVRLLDGTQGELLVAPILDDAGLRGFVVAVMEYSSLYPQLLADIAPGHPLRVVQGGEALYARAVPATPPGYRLIVDSPGSRLQIDLWPVPGMAAGRRLANLLLVTGLITGGLLALALRLAALGRERADRAERASRELREQIAESGRARAALDEKERELSSVFESISDAFYTLDRDWRFTLVNPRAEQLMQRPREALVGTSVWEAFPDTLGTIVEREFRAAVEHGRSSEFEVYFPPLSAWFVARIFPHPQGLAVYFQDVSERKIAQLGMEKARAASERAQRLAQLGSWDYDLAGGALRWSDEAVRIFDLPSGQAPGTVPALLRLVHFDDRRRVEGALERLSAGEAELDAEFRLLRPGGETRHVRALGTLVRDEAGHALTASGAIQDITERRQSEEALRELSRRLEQSLVMNRLVLDNSLDVICVIDANGRFAQVSSASQALWGYSPSELVGRSYFDLAHPDDRAHTLRQGAAVLAGRPTVDFRNRYLRKDGSVVSMQWSAVWSPRDRMMFAVARDVTEVERQSRALQDAKESLQRAQQIARMGAWELDLADGRLTWSDEVYGIFQLAREDFAGTLDAFSDRIHPEDRAMVMAAQQRAVSAGTELDIEHRILLADGGIGHVHQRARLLRDDQGRPRRLSGSVQDITERKRFQERLERSEMLLKIAGQAARLGGWAVNLEERRVYWSDEVCAIHERPSGHSPDLDEALSYYAPPFRQRIAECFRACATEGIPYDEELQIVTAGGRLVWVRSIGHPVRDAEGRIARVQGAFQDITDRKQAEAALQEERGFLVALLESLSEGIVACDADARLTLFNRATRELHGLPEAPIPASQWAAHYNLFRADGVTPLPSEEVPLFRALGGEVLREVEIVIAPRDQSPRTVLCSGQQIRSASGTLLGAVVAMHDITERKRAQAMEAGQRDILAGIAARRPLGEILRAITRLSERQQAQALCSILLLDEEGKHVLTGAAPSLPAAFNAAVHGLEIGPKAGSCGTAAWRGERVVVSDIENDPLWEDYVALAREHGLRACWSTPVKSSDGRVIATFANYYRSVREPSAAELEVIDSLAALAAVAIEQAAAYRDLELSEQRFRSLFDEHPDAVYSLDLEGRFTSVNGRFRRLAGVSPEQVLGQLYDERVAQEQRDVVRAHFGAATRGEARTYELTGLAAGGNRVDLRITNLPMVVDGRVTGVFGIAQDISLLRKHQRDLSDALDAAETLSRQMRKLSDSSIAINRDLGESTLFQQLVDRARDILDAHQAVVSVDGEDGAAHVLNAVSLSEKYAAWRDYDIPVDGSGIYMMVAERMRPMRLTQAELEAHPRWRNFGAEAGRHPPMRGWLAVPLLGSDGRCIGILQLSDKRRGEFTEDDEQVAVQFAQMAVIAIERARLIAKLSVRDRFFDMSAEVFVIFDPAQKKWIEVNPVLCEITGYDKEMLLSRPFLDFVHPDDWPVSDERAEALREGKTVANTFVNRYVCKDGSVRWMEWVSSPSDEGLVYGVGRDITERVKADAALRQTLTDLNNRNRELQDFAFIASHDLQEPLRKIRAFSDRLQQRHAADLAAEARDYLDRTSQAAARMQVLIDDLLAYSRIAARGKPFSPVDLDRVLADVVEDLEARLESSGGRVVAGRLPTIDGDATQLRQVFQNLLSNALKFRAPDRPPVVRIDAEPVALPDGPGWILRFTDNGIGFEPRHAEKVFGPFQRLHGRQDYEGTGIGLAIVRRIVERHRGTIEAEGRPGEGAVFVLRLPERQQEDAPRLAGPMSGT